VIIWPHLELRFNLMTVDEAIEEFGSGRKVCIALGISDRNFPRWKKQGWIPQAQQLRIEILTEGKLKADEFGPDRKPLSR
jgi:hypothetical protein